MSFQHNNALEAQPTTWRRQDDPEYADDPEFKRFASGLSDKLFSLTSNISRLVEEVAKLGTKRETERIRERVQTLISETADSFKEIGDGLKKIQNWHDLGPSQVYTQGKLKQEFQASLTEFQALQKQASEKLKSSAVAARTAYEEGGSSGGAQSQQQQQQQQQLLQEQPRLADQSEVDFQESLIMEREAEIRDIETSVRELNELFTDVAHMVADQGNTLDIIEGNVVQTRDDTRGASHQLKQASRHQRSARGKACCLLIILVIVLTVIILAAALN